MDINITLSEEQAMNLRKTLGIATENLRKKAANSRNLGQAEEAKQDMRDLLVIDGVVLNALNKASS